MKKILILLSLIFTAPVFAADMRFVQVSDINFSESQKIEILEKFVDEINSQKNIEFVVFTGDNLNRPVKTDLEAFLKEVKKLNCPFYIVIGDHDVNKHKDLSKIQYIKTIKKKIRKYKPEAPNYVFEKDGVIFIVVDGSKDVIPGTNGFYKEETLKWLEVELSLFSDKNVIIFQHFPLIPPSEREAYYTFKPENYLQLLNNHQNVKAVISGHFGVNREQDVNGVLHISTAPLPQYRVIDILDYDTPNPTIWAQLKKLNINKP